VQGDASADRHLVADDEPRQRLGPVEPLARAGEGQQAGQCAAAGMALGERMSVMGVEAVYGRGVGQRRPGRTGQPAVEQEGCSLLAGGEKRYRRVPDDAADLQPAAGSGHPDQVEKEALGVAGDVGWDIAGAQAQDEIASRAASHLYALNRKPFGSKGGLARTVA